jgi:hypothetical protein
MISVQEVVSDPDLVAPQQYIILRSAGTFIAGGFQSIVSTLQMFGPVQNSSPKEIAMVPEADRVSSMMSFWSTVPIYVTRANAASDKLQYPPGGETYRVVNVYHDPGCGYWKAIAARESAT